MRRYRIGEFSMLSGVSKDTLRYYDKAGVLSPSYKADNGYRYYTEYDLMRLIQIRTLRGLDSTLEECTQITALPVMSDRLARREAELTRQINQMTDLRDRIRMLQAEIQNCLQECGKCYHTKTIATYSVPLDRGNDARRLAEAWMKHSAYAHLSFCFHELTESPTPYLTIGILRSYAEAQGVDVSGAEVRDSREAVRCVLRMHDPMYPTLEELAPLTDYMQAHHLCPNGPWTYRLRFIDQADSAETIYYVGLCVPVKRNGSAL